MTITKKEKVIKANYLAKKIDGIMNLCKCSKEEAIKIAT